MRQQEPADSSLSRDLPTLPGMEMDRAWPISGEGTIQHRKIRVSTEMHQALAVLRIAGIGQGLPPIFDSISEAMEVLRVGHGLRKYSRFTDRERSIGDVFEINREGGVHEPWQSGEQGSEKSLCTARADYRERWTLSSLVFRKNYRIEKVGDEIGKVIGMVMGEENVGNPMPVHAGLYEIHQCSWSKVQQYRVVGANKIARGCSCGVDVCAGSENGQPHSPTRHRSRPRLSNGLASLI